ncbi:MAG: hypothetical protein J1F71_03990 [Clostridiales bacterium]|nr:hypothetical protein [Clostridiales bacterium]
MIVLIAFIVLLTVLAIVFIIALRKRAPVVKVVMAPQSDNRPAEDEAMDENTAAMPQSEAVDTAPEEQAEGKSEPKAEDEEDDSDTEDDDEDDDDAPKYVTEGTERVRYNRSMTAKVAQLPREAKEWYSELKNELLSYEKVKDRMSWKRETFRIGRMVVARLVVRGKTLSLLLAVEPAGYNGTKFAVDDVSNIASTADTPTMYRVKNPRRAKYAKEMIAGMMKELKIFKDSHYEAQDFFLPYEGDLAFMRRGLVKRIVTGSTRTFKIEEVDNLGLNDAAATDDGNA